jgi:endonuclease/exonuclease/phosphatase family metal-dependent hydrolase
MGIFNTRAEAKFCFHCENEIRTNKDQVKPLLQCLKCERVVHRWPKCSKLRSKTQDHAVWKCPDHINSQDIPEEARKIYQRQLDIEKPCIHCGDKFKGELETILHCRRKSCDAVCHRKTSCSQLERQQNSRSKNIRNWKCPAHRPKTSIYKGKKCNHCTKTIPSNYRPRHLIECRFFGECGNICHKKEQCTNINYKDKAAKNWICKECAKLPDVSPQPSMPQDPPSTTTETHHTTPAQEEAPTSDSNENNQHPEEESTSPKKPAMEYCSSLRCGKKLSVRSITCAMKECGKTFHQSCADVDTYTYKQYLKKKIDWACPQCIKQAYMANHKVVHNKGAKEPSEDDPHDPDEDPKNYQKSLKILQWNVAGLKHKMWELRNKAMEQDLDIILIQETKLKEGRDETVPGFSIPNYTSIRVDRKDRDGGGLISYIKTTLTHEHIKDEACDTTETSTFRVKLTRNKWIKISNVYCPPLSASRQYRAKHLCRLDTSIIPATPNSLICGDFNAHSPMWDSIAASDIRGSEVEDWMVAKKLTLLNNGQATRISPKGKKSTPDITLCGSSLNSKTSYWNVNEEDAMGNSDHTPIFIVVYSEVNHNPVFYGKAKWKFKNVDWKKFAEETDNILPTINSDNIVDHWKALNQALNDAGNKHVGRVKVGKNTKSWMNPHVRAAIKRRNKLRRKLRTHRDEWREAWKTAQNAIREAKEDAWKESLESVITDADPTKLWRVIKSLNGSPCTNTLTKPCL